MELKDVQGCFFSNHHVQLCTFLIYSHCILVHFFPRPLFSITIILNVHFIKFKFYKKKKKITQAVGEVGLVHATIAHASKHVLKFN